MHTVEIVVTVKPSNKLELTVGICDMRSLWPIRHSKGGQRVKWTAEGGSFPTDTTTAIKCGGFGCFTHNNMGQFYASLSDVRDPQPVT